MQSFDRTPGCCLLIDKVASAREQGTDFACYSLYFHAAFLKPRYLFPLHLAQRFGVASYVDRSLQRTTCAMTTTGAAESPHAAEIRRMMERVSVLLEEEHSSQAVALRQRTQELDRREQRLNDRSRALDERARELQERELELDEWWAAQQRNAPAGWHQSGKAWCDHCGMRPCGRSEDCNWHIHHNCWECNRVYKQQGHKGSISYKGGGKDDGYMNTKGHGKGK